MSAERETELLARSLSEIRRLRAQLDDARAAKRSPIAIIGIGLRMPGSDGEITDLDGLAALSSEGGDIIREIPAERFDIDRWFDADRDAAGKIYTRRAALLDDIAGFDAELFRISPKEAQNLDPQQRLVLETAWDALERAGCPPPSLAGSRTGVYVGAAPCQYRCGDDMYAITGQDTAFTAGRVAYVLGLHGPAMAVNTTCSSSLTALHLAVQSLRSGECGLALAASAHAIISPEGFVNLARTQALAPDGWSKTFSAAADGFGRGEGVVAVALARLDEALAQGRPILAVIRGSALVHDGASRGITAPNSGAQREMLRVALADAGLAGADIDAVECHGTGTVIGDPVEVNALAEVYGEGRDGLPPLVLTGLKASVGHLEPAAGLAGLAALLAALKHQRLAANPCAEIPNPNIDWARLPVSLSTEPTPWPRGERVRRAGVSSFGMSGTNAHVIIEEAPAVQDGALDRPLPASLPLLLSARSEAALRTQAARWAAWLETGPSTPLAAIKRSAALHRAHLDARAAIHADTPGALGRLLGKLAAGEADAAILVGQDRSPVPGRTETGVVFVFPGHGSQWLGMGAALLAESPVFAAAVDNCDRALLPHTGWSVRAVLSGGGDGLPDADRIDVIQPCLFAMGVALAAVWQQELGVAPSAVVGHSVGEIAAAVVVGALSLADGARLAALRGRLIADAAEQRDPGAMLAVAAPAEEVQARLAPWQEQLCVAVVNAADACVVAGERDALGALEDVLAAAGMACRRVAIGFGAHSPLMDPVLEPFAAALDGLAPSAARLPFYSPIVGAACDGATLDSRYWQNNVRAPVRFDRAIAAAAADGRRAFIELGGHPVLTRPMAASAGSGAVVVGSLRRGAGGLEQLHRGLAQLHCAGVAVDWTRAFGTGPVAELPTYAFQRRRCWIDQPTRPPEPRTEPAPAQTPTALHVAPVPTAVPPPAPAAAGIAATTGTGPGAAAAVREVQADSLPGAGFMAEQLRVFAQLTRRQIDVATAYATAATPVAATPVQRVTPAAVAAHLHGALGPALAGTEATEQALEAAAIGYIRAALHQLGLELQPGQRFSTRWLIEELTIVPAHHRLAGRLCELLAQAGDLRGGDGEWTVLRPLPAAPAPDPGAGADPRMDLLSRCAGSLADVLTGRQEALGLLFPDGETGLVSRVYTDTSAARAFNGLLAEIATAIIGTHAGHLRALEIGAGTGGTTAAVLPRLPAQRVSYVFTDLGAGFLPAARARFAAYPHIDFRPLDIEQAPAEQGFETGAYDLVLAANVLHATRDLAETVRHAVSLLAPGGVLLLLEGVQPRAWVDLTFGLTTGWWRFQDRALRPDHPLIDAGQWCALLADLGLPEAASVTHPGSEMGIIIAKRP